MATRGLLCVRLAGVLLFVGVLMPGCKDDAPPIIFNHLLSGPWLSMPDDYPGETGGIYLVFDGHGIISDSGGMNMPAPAGTYEVLADSTVTMTLTPIHDPAMRFSSRLLPGGRLKGLFISEEGTTALFTMFAVSDAGKMQGTWSGTLRASGVTKNVEFQVSPLGIIESFEGLAGPVSGRAFADSLDRVVAMLDTGESDAWHDVFMNIGALSGITWSGTLQTDTSGGDGTFSLTRQLLRTPVP